MRLIHVKVKDENIRIDQIHHDITILDCLKGLLDKYNFQLDNMTTERELHINDGFGVPLQNNTNNLIGVHKKEMKIK